MSVELAGLVISGISALASVIQVWRATRDAGIELTTEQLAKAAEPKPTTLEHDEIAALSQVISDDILDAILGNIEKAKKRFTDAIDDPACNKQCEDAEEEIAASTTCAALQRIKRLNNRQLPPDLESLWIQFQCG